MAMKFVLRAAAGIGLGASCAAWAQSPAAPAAASDQWSLRQTPESCYLTRNFADNGAELELRIESFGPNSPYHFLLSGDGLPIRKQSSMLARVGFGGEAAAKDTIVLAGGPKTSPEVLLVVAPAGSLDILGWFYTYRQTKAAWLTPLDPSAQELFIAFPDTEPLTLPLGPMQDEYARLDSCANALADKLSAVVSADGQPVSGPRLRERETVIERTKYPVNLLLNRINGVAELRMTVDDTGRVRACVPQRVVWARQFGDDACRAMEEYARFEPARDATGKAVPAMYRTAATFIIYNW
jgi:hypothetical protein